MGQGVGLGFVVVVVYRPVQEGNAVAGGIILHVGDKIFPQGQFRRKLQVQLPPQVQGIQLGAGAFQQTGIENQPHPVAGKGFLVVHPLALAGPAGAQQSPGSFRPGEIHQAHIPRHQLHAGAPGTVQHHFQHIRGDHVVAVHKHQIPPGGLGNTQVAGPAHPAVGHVQHPEAAVQFSVVAADFQRIVGAAVVDQDDLKFGPGLRQEGIEAVSQPFLCIIDRHHNADFVFRHCPLFPFQ